MAAGPSRAGEGAQVEVLLHRHAGEDAPALGGVGDAPLHDLVRRQLVDALAVEVDLARGRAAAARRCVRRTVVLPAPLLPMSVTRLPASTENDTPFTASIRP